VALLPFAYLFCQALTFIVYEGRWRWWCLVPLLFFLGVCSVLIWVQTPVAFVTVVIAAPSAGMLALACVWGLFSRSGGSPAPVEDGNPAATGQRES
jgi:glucose dehydrogenase